MKAFSWLIKLFVGFMFASSSELAASSGFALVAFTLINAIGLHVLFTALVPEEYKVVPPKPILIGLAIAACLAIGAGVVYAQPANGCEQCLANGNSWWWCFAIYGALCF